MLHFASGGEGRYRNCGLGELYKRSANPSNLGCLRSGDAVDFGRSALLAPITSTFNYPSVTVYLCPFFRPTCHTLPCSPLNASNVNVLMIVLANDCFRTSNGCGNEQPLR